MPNLPLSLALAALLAGSPAGTAALAGTTPAGAASDPITALAGTLPGETLIAYFGRPATLTPQRGIGRLITLAESARRIGLVPAKMRLPADIAACLPLLGRFPHAVALLDARATRLRPGVHRLESLQVALVLLDGGEHQPIVERIQALIELYTNRDVATVETLPPPEGAPETLRQTYRLKDTRLPDWAVIEWALLPDRVIITVGNGGLRRCLETLGSRSESLLEDGWFAEAFRRTHAADAAVAWTIHADGLRAALGQVIEARVEAVLAGLGIADLNRGLWSITRSGRQIDVYAAQRRRGRDRFARLSAPPEANAAATLIPPQAGRYCILRVAPADLLRRIVRGWMASRRPKHQAATIRWWNYMQEAAGVDADRDILAHLEDRMILHTHPPHPLGIPLLCTVVIPVRGEGATVRDAVDRLFSRIAAWQEYDLRERGFRLRPLLERDDDGTWFVRYGVIILAAMRVAEDRVVIAYSPEAVRANLPPAATQPESAVHGTHPAESTP